MTTPFSISVNSDATSTTQGVPTRRASIHHNDDIEETDNGEKSASPADTLGNDPADKTDDDDTAEMERRSSVVQALARSYSRASGAPGGNPFMAGEDSPLNPHSPNFNAREWAKAVVELVSQDGASFRSAGVAFQHLNVHGFGEATDYQKDVFNVWLSLSSLARKVGGGGRQRIDILRDFDGVVRQGEMLVVLGPPGSGCSTLLKTIAGEMNGIYVDDKSYFNYQGEFL
jgi:ATP-binding cassette, subfamily G (WHITE), member 2, PDR